MEINLNESEGKNESNRINNNNLPLEKDESLIKIKDVKSGKGFYPLIGRVVL